MASLEVLSAKVRGFFARIDPGKSQAEMDELVFAAYSRGEAQVNTELRSRYGHDLNSFAPVYYSQLVVAGVGQPAMTNMPANGGVILAPPASHQQQQIPMAYYDGNNSQPKVYYVQQQQQQPGMYPQNTYAMTPFSSSQSYPPPTYDQYRQQKRSNDACFFLTAALACLICVDFD